MRAIQQRSIRLTGIFAVFASLVAGRAGAQPAGADGGGARATPRGASGAAVREAPPPPAPKQPVVVAPELVHFEPAPYPAAALEAGLEAEVVLTLTLASDGSVSAAEVARGAGHGFDEAAARAARAFRFSPATVDGVPTSVKISYVYRFTLEEAPEPVAAPPRRTGQLEGAVHIAGSEIPISGAVVSVTTAAGRTFTLETDPSGSWALESLPPGTYRVSVSAPGYQPLDATEAVVAGEATGVTLRLAPAPDPEGGLEILVEGERPPREVTRRTLSQRELSRVPGTGGDALRALQSLPGVARPPFGLAGMLIMRGSAPEDSRAFLQGMHIPLAYHFGGLSSVVPTELIDRIDYYPSNFSTRYGRAMGGIIDIGLRAPNTRCHDDYGKESTREGCFHGLAQVDLIDTRLLLEGPIGERWSFALAGRRSWMETWFKPLAEEAELSVTSAPVYYDFQAIAETRPTPDSRLRLVGFGSSDRLELLPSAGGAGTGNLDLSEQTYRGQVLYEAQLAPDVHFDAMLGAGVIQERFGFGAMKFDVEWYPVEVRSEVGWKLEESVTLNFGLDLELAPYSAEVTAPPPPLPGEPDDGSFGLRPPLHTEIRGTELAPAAYLEAELTPTPRLRVVPGVRFDYARKQGAMDASPRINARYDLVSPDLDSTPERAARRTTVKAGAGVFTQPPEFQEFDSVFGTPGLHSNRALHYTVGLEQGLTRQVQLDVEGFYKDLRTLVSRSPDASGDYAYGNRGSGYVIGLESMLKYHPDDRFFGWIAYTLSRSILKDTPESEPRFFEYDQTHNLTALGSYRLGRGWEVGARFRLISGPLDTPVRTPPQLRAVHNADSGRYVPLEGEPLSERLPALHQLDLRVDKVWQLREWKLSAYVDVQNVYNHMAPEYVNHNYDFTQREYGTGLPILPSLGVRGEF